MSGDVVAQLGAVRQKLGKKKEFEEAARELASLFPRYSTLDASAQGELRSLVSRAQVLLQTRYTGRGFWVAGQALFEAAAGAIGPTSPAEHREPVDRALARAREELGEGEEGGAAEGNSAPAIPPPPAAYAFEGQLSAPPPPRERDPLEMLVAHLVEAGAAAAAADEAGAAAAAAAAGGEAGGGGEGGAAGPGQARGRRVSPGAEELRRWAEDEAAAVAAAVAAAEAGGGAAAGGAGAGGMFEGEVIPGLEEVINSTIEEAAENAHAGPPPASAAAVRALRVEAVTKERLDQLGEGVECAVCREALQEGEDVQVMPCNSHHVYHPQCLKPWLEKHNSCPVCRFELPTDDHEYERRKEVAKEREEERRGVENALPGGEFMFM